MEYGKIKHSIGGRMTDKGVDRRGGDEINGYPIGVVDRIERIMIQFLK